MRESNHNLPSQNRASIVISSALYDRRAFDSPISTLPLVSSLHHLSYLTSTSPRIREILCVDGGLERLVRIAISGIDMAHASARPACTCASGEMSVDQPVASTSTAPACSCAAKRPRGPKFKPFSAYSKKASSASTSAYDRALLMTYTLSLQSLVNVGVRGSESIRTRVVQAGVLALAVRVLKGFLVERARHAAELAEAQEMAFRAARSTARLRAISLLQAPTGVSPEAEADPILPPVTRTPTPDAVVLVADDAANVAEEREQDAQDAREDADLESSVMQEGARQRSSTIKSGPSPAAEVVHAVEPVEGDAMDVDGPESGDSDGERDPTTRSFAASPAPQEATPTPDAPQVPMAPFEGAMAATPLNLVSPSVSAASTAITSAASLLFRFREDDVLLCLQLLAYLSKYPHIRRVFHDPDMAFDCMQPRSDEEEASAPHGDCGSDVSRNVFSLVEKFTVRPSPSDRTALRLPSDLMYWAGVVLRNSTRKDEARGGVRQCANHACGRWEAYAREFAKCRRCRKAKYCSKQCQSKAWQSGHRYWCSAREASDHSGHRHGHGEQPPRSNDASPARGNVTLDEDDEDALEGLQARPHPRTHVLLRGTMPEFVPDEELFLGGGPGINDPMRVGNLDDVEEAEDRFF